MVDGANFLLYENAHDCSADLSLCEASHKLFIKHRGKIYPSSFVIKP